MNPSNALPFVSHARDCAWTMRDNANYVRAELPNVELTDALRARAEQVCRSLLNTGRQVMDEVLRLNDRLVSDTSAASLRESVDRILQLCGEEMERVDQLVRDFQTAGDKDPTFVLASVLVTESATNILHAFNRTQECADSLGDSTD